MDQLINEYDINIKRVNEIALNSVINVQVPVVNTLSSLPRVQLIQLLHNCKTKFKDIPVSQQSFFLTILTDVLTCMIKYNDFYESFNGNNSYIVDLLCDKIKRVPKIKLEEFNQIMKYASRIPDYPQLKICLTHILSVNNAARQSFTHKHEQITANKNILKPLEPITNINNNTIVNTPAKFVSKGMYVGENKVNDRLENIENKKITPFKVDVKFVNNKIKLVKVAETKPKDKLTEIKSNAKVTETKPNINFTEMKPNVKLTEPNSNINLTEMKSIVKLTEPNSNVKFTKTNFNVNSTEIQAKELEKGKRKNVFEILMNAARNKKKKLF